MTGRRRGTLFSPTDPIAALGMLRSAHAPAEIEATVAGESLLEDGLGVIAFSILVQGPSVGRLVGRLAPAAARHR